MRRQTPRHKHNTGASQPCAVQFRRSEMASLLAVDDFVGISFFVTSMALLASTIFFYQERELVTKKWQTSLTVMTMVTFIAFVHYLYMRDLWVTTQASPITYRYIDWFITVPLQIVEFYLILSAVTKVSPSVFWRLLIASVVMLVAGYIGEAGLGDVTLFFALGMFSWFVILFEVFFGVAGHLYSKVTHAPTRFAFNGLRFIVTIGWAIYPIGYAYGYMIPQPDINVLNIIYNIADFLNKIAFGMMIWYAARCDAEKINKAEWI